MNPLIALYLEELSSHTARSRRLVAFWLTALERFSGQNGGLSALNPVRLEKFRQELTWTPGPRGQLYAPNTVYQAIRMVRAFLAWAATHGHLPSNPAQDMILPRPPVRPPPLLSAAELEAVLDSVSPTSPRGLRDRAMLETLAGTGMPVAYVPQLELGHLDNERQVLRWLGRDRESALSERLADVLERYLTFARPCFCYRDDQPLLFLNQEGQALLEVALGLVVRRAGERAGLPAGRVTGRILALSGQALADDFARRRLAW